MTLDDVLSEAVDPKHKRAFAIGLLVAIIDFVAKLDAYGKGLGDFKGLIARYPIQSETSARKKANTLIVKNGDSTLSLRPFYNAFETLMRATEKRFDYPSCAPHATQAWGAYTHWFKPLLSSSPEQAAKFRERVLEQARSMFPPQSTVADQDLSEPPLFALLLQNFDFTAHKNEPPGAAFQGAVFAFLRADNPHLQVEIDKVKTGSRRVHRVGDIDAWQGDKLIVSAEVKHFLFKEENLPDVAQFVDEVSRRHALGIVVALDFEDAARDSLEGSGIRARSLEELLEAVTLWDPLKQGSAVDAYLYYIVHREQKSELTTRVRHFLDQTAFEHAQLTNQEGRAGGAGSDLFSSS